MEPFTHYDRLIHSYIIHQDQENTVWIVASWTMARSDPGIKPLGRDYYDWSAYIGIAPTTFQPTEENILRVKNWGTKAPQAVAEYYFGSVAKKLGAPWRD